MSVRHLCLGVLISFCAVPRATGAAAPALTDVLLSDLTALCSVLHRHPELSTQEAGTARLLAERLAGLGFEVTTAVGGYGIVGVFRNGDGPTILVRTDLDALPVREETGLPDASRVTVRDAAGSEVGVMHACGHDIHMTAWVGAATLLAQAKAGWRGTLVMVGQPAEETGEGARAMLRDGLLSRFPRPDYALALHVTPELAAGTVGVTPGYALANVDSVDVTIHGRGGHGAYPHRTVDPIVIAARTVVSLQTIVARENSPFDPAVVTVGSIHGGTKHNVIPDEVRLQITVRSYDERVRQQLLSAIERIVKAEAVAAGAPDQPTIAVTQGAHATRNDPALAQRIAAVLRKELSEDAVSTPEPSMAGEDFSEYGRAGVPAVLFWVGTSNPQALEAARTRGTPVPSLHSARFTPDREPTIRTAVRAMTAAVLELTTSPTGRRAASPPARPDLARPQGDGGDGAKGQ